MPMTQPTPARSRVVPAGLVLPVLVALAFVASAMRTGTALAQKPAKPGSGGHGASGGSGHGAAGSGGGSGGHSAGGGGTAGHGARGGGAPAPGISPGAGFPPMGIVPGGARRGTPGKKPAAPREKTAETIDPDKLPPGYRVPQVPPDALTTTEQWDEEPFGGDDKKQRDRNRNLALQKYKVIIQSGMFSGEADRKLVADVVRYKLSELTRKENREKAFFLRISFQRDLEQPQNRTAPRDVRKFMLNLVAKEAPRLFEYHAIARINGAILLAEMSDSRFNEVDAEGNKPAVPCVAGVEPLLKLVNDKNQLVAPRIWGVNGLVRLATLPEIKPQDRIKIVDTLVARMYDSKAEHPWYQFRLAEGLGRLTVIQDQDKRPFVPQALATVLADSERPWIVRCEAAQSLGRLPYTLDIDMGLVAQQTATLVRDMTEAYNKDPKLAIWKLCFFKIYGAFKPIDDEDTKKRGMLSQVDRGVLSGYKRTVQEVFDLVLPIVVAVINKPDGLDNSLQNLKKWLDANPPKSFKIHPLEEPIVRKPGTIHGQAPAEGPANPPVANNNGAR
jgi:hypothetical protein